jgi:hypothetical protein
MASRMSGKHSVNSLRSAYHERAERDSSSRHRRDLLQRGGAVGKPLGRDVRAAPDECASLNVILGRVDTVERDHLTVSEIDHRETACRGIATQHTLIIANRKTDSLKAQVILVRPEPRKGMIFDRVSNQHLGDDGSLIVGVLHRFEPDRRIVGKGVRM